MPVKWVKPTDGPQSTSASSNTFFITNPPIKRGNGENEPAKPFLLDYSKIRENEAFGKRFAGKYLAYKVLSNSVPISIIPVDILEVELFYKEYFKGAPEKVFSRYCKFHDLEEENTLAIYKNTLKWNKICNPNPSQDLTLEMESLNECFLRLLS